MKVILFLIFIAPGMEEPLTQAGEMPNIQQCFAFARQIQEDWLARTHDGPYKLSVGCELQVTPASLKNE